MTQHERRANLGSEAIERSLDELAPGNLVRGIRLRRPLERDGRATQDRQRQPSNPAAPELVEGEMDHDAVQPATQRALAVVLVPALPRARERLVGGIKGLVGVAQDPVRNAVHVVRVVAIRLVGRAVALALDHGLRTVLAPETFPESHAKMMADQGGAITPAAAAASSRYRPGVPQTIRTIRPDELVAWFEAFGSAFYFWLFDPAAQAAVRREHFEIGRIVGAFEDDGTIVGTFRTFGSLLTLPGGARVPVNAVSAVSVRPTHRRRGTLTRLDADDVRRAVARGDAASILISAEWPIYGRFGYGPATWQARWTLRTRGAALALEPIGTIENIDALAARKVLPDLYDRFAAGQPGEISRPDYRWDEALGLIELSGRPRWRGSIVIHRDASGELDGFARYHGEEVWEDMVADNVLALDELHALTEVAELDLWRHLAQMDITASIRADTRREREPVQWYLADARAARRQVLSDFLWVRPLDVPRLLGERSYERDGELTLEVTDRVDGSPGPAAGTYRLEVHAGAATCRTTDAAPELTLDARALGAAILGGTRLIDACRAGGATEHRAGALAEADALLRTADPPWCSSWF
jgi:predicted acetyltransferase